MSAGAGGIRTYPVSSNRAPFYSDATVDSGGLLASNATKTITPKYSDGNGGSVAGIGMQIQVTNQSGQEAQITFSVARNETGDQVDVAVNPLVLPAGATLPLTNLRIKSILEKNSGGGSQTGKGVEYFIVMEPKK